MDAIAVSLAMDGTHTGVAALTEPQATPFAGWQPIIEAGRATAEHAFWLLASHRVDFQFSKLPQSSDPVHGRKHQGVRLPPGQRPDLTHWLQRPLLRVRATLRRVRSDRHAVTGTLRAQGW